MNKNKKMGLVSVAGAVIAIIVVLSYRAWLGGLIYIVAALLADHVLRANLKEKTGEEYPNYVVALITEKKVKTPKYVSDCKKSSDFLEKVQAYMIAALPFVIVICVVLYFTWDSSREVEEAYEAIDKAVDEYYDEYFNDLYD